MKTIILAIAACTLMGAAVHAEETMGEKSSAVMNDTAAAAKKGAHRVKEAVCMKSDAKCLAEKAKHRVQEGGTAVKNEAKEVGNNIDGK